MDSCFSSLDTYQSISADTDYSDYQLTIRKAVSQDLKSLAQVLTDSFHPPHGPMGWMSPLLKLGIYEDLRIRLGTNSQHYLCLVASLQHPRETVTREDVVGTVEISLRSSFPWSKNTERHLYIANLAVKNSHRRRGIARKLLRSCEQTALQWGFDCITLHVLDNNLEAQQLYYSSGYKLHRIDYSFTSWLFQHPKRLFLNKQMNLR